MSQDEAPACGVLCGHPCLQVQQGSNANFQFKTHPNIDKAGYNNGILGLKDPSRPFPTGESRRTPKRYTVPQNPGEPSKRPRPCNQGPATQLAAADAAVYMWGMHLCTTCTIPAPSLHDPCTRASMCCEDACVCETSGSLGFCPMAPVAAPVESDDRPTNHTRHHMTALLHHMCPPPSLTSSLCLARVACGAQAVSWVC